MSGSPEIRPATAEDAWFLYSLRNDPVVREASFNSNQLSWEQHLLWLDAKTADGSMIFIVEVGGVPVGYVRFHPIEGEGEFDVAVAITAAERGRGLGARSIGLASGEAEARGAQRLVARVRPGNDASIRAFEAAGYSGALRLNGNGSMVVLTRVAGA